MIDEKLLYIRLGERIRELRERQDGASGRMTQATLALRVGLERTSITNIERGGQKVPLHVLFRICEVLRVPVADVLPPTVEVQRTEEEPVTEVQIGGLVVRATPLIKQALSSLLDKGDGHGPQL